jgi:hypothetical protein
MKISDRYLLDLLREVVSARAGGVCEISGEAEGDPHHIFGRANKFVRYDPDNCVWLSNSAHRWAEAHKKEFRTLMISKRGREWWNELVIKKNIIVKDTPEFREGWKGRLTAELREVAA